MIPSQPTVAAGTQSHRHWPVMGNPSGGGHHYHYHGMMVITITIMGWWKPEREISNDACWWSRWFKQWEQLWRLSVLHSASGCIIKMFPMNAVAVAASGPQGWLILSPPQAVRRNVTPLMCFSSSVPFASGCDNSKGGGEFLLVLSGFTWILVTHLEIRHPIVSLAATKIVSKIFSISPHLNILR